MVGRTGAAIHIVCFSRVLLIGSSTYLSLAKGSSVNEVLIVVNTMLIGLSNGYVQTITMIYAPSAIDEKTSLSESQKRSQKSIIGNLMLIMMTAGISIGSAFQILYSIN